MPTVTTRQDKQHAGAEEWHMAENEMALQAKRTQLVVTFHENTGRQGLQSSMPIQPKPQKNTEQGLQPSMHIQQS